MIAGAMPRASVQAAKSMRGSPSSKRTPTLASVVAFKAQLGRTIRCCTPSGADMFRGVVLLRNSATALKSCSAASTSSVISTTCGPSRRRAHSQGGNHEGTSKRKITDHDVSLYAAPDEILSSRG